MGYAYVPNGNASDVGDAFSGFSYEDPGSQPFAAFDPARLDVAFFASPIQDNVLGLWQAATATNAWQRTWTCLAGLVVGDPVYVKADGSLDLATSADITHLQVIGFCRYKPTATSCFISQFHRLTTGVGLVGGSPVYLQDDGSFGSSPGTLTLQVGVAVDSQEAVLSAVPGAEFSGVSGFSGTSGFSGVGTSGFSGGIGPQGTSGFSGTYSGYSGKSGYSGNSGYSGANPGASGYSGYSGKGLTVMSLLSASKSANETRSTTVISDDASLQLSLAVGTYNLDGSFFVSTANSDYYTQGIRTQWAFTGTQTNFEMDGRLFAAEQDYYFYTSMFSVQTAMGSYFDYAAPQILTMLRVQGTITVTVAGTFKLQWAAQNASYAVTLKKGSWLKADAGSGACSGYSGATGVGTAGPSGISGFSGAFSGMSGSSGVSGFVGATGDSGASGFSGSIGDSGVSGVSGGPGLSGRSGTSGWSGEGSSGYSGRVGTSGVSGFSGAATSGWSGVSGFTGKSGISGFSGTSGFTGASGTSGLGLSGCSGTSGATGNSGISGFTGQSGVSGAVGTSGTSGKSGYSGPSGISGINGAVGTSGFSGKVGPDGDSGYSGFSGTYSGYSGQSGWSSTVAGSSGASGFSGVANGTEVVQYVLDGGGYPLENGTKGCLYVPYGCTIQSWVVGADQEGSVEIDVWRQTYGGYPPDFTDSICGAGVKPIIMSDDKAQSSNLTGWTAYIPAGSFLVFSIVTASCITRCTLALIVQRT